MHAETPAGFTRELQRPGTGDNCAYLVPTYSNCRPMVILEDLPGKLHTEAIAIKCIWGTHTPATALEVLFQGYLSITYLENHLTLPTMRSMALSCVSQPSIPKSILSN